MAIYHAVMKGSYQGQAVVNNLYYRTGIGFDLDGLSIGGALDLAQELKAQVWPSMKNCLPTGYTLESIDVYPYHDGTFDLLYQNPATVNVLESGYLTDATDGPCATAILKFNLEPTQVFGNGIFPPKRGYIALGPIISAWIDNAGKLTDELFLDAEGYIQTFASKLAMNITSLLPPVVFYPIRVRQLNILGVYKPVSFADVNACVVRRRTSFRRSRMSEI